jgi:hypothetical protein
MRSASNEVCACLLETGSRQVEIVERCLRCGLCMDSDAYEDALSRAKAAEAEAAGLHVERAYERSRRIELERDYESAAEAVEARVAELEAALRENVGDAYNLITQGE